MSRLLKYLMIIVVAFVAVDAVAQRQTLTKPVKPKKEKVKGVASKPSKVVTTENSPKTQQETQLPENDMYNDKDEVFKAVEVMPQFPGGEAELLKYISKNVKYPKNAMNKNIQGRVVVQFVVTKTGAVGETKIVRSVDSDLGAEAIRVVKTLPDFIPGTMNGVPVNVWYTLPITFKLQGF